MTCCGLSEASTPIKGIHPLKKAAGWTQVQQQWHQQLSQLASEFAQGHCPPQPTRATICRGCDFKSICRIE